MQLHKLVRKSPTINEQFSYGTGKVSGHWRFIVAATKLVPELSVGDKCFGAQTKWNKRTRGGDWFLKQGRESACILTSKGFINPKCVSALQCQQGHKFSTRTGNQFHTERGRLGTRRIADALKCCILCYWICSPVSFFLLFFFILFFFLSICRLGDPVKWNFPEPAQKPVARKAWSILKYMDKLYNL